MARIFIGSGWVNAEDGALGGSLTGRLSGREFALLQRLAKERGEVIAWAELERSIWGDTTGKPRRIKALIQRLRKKVEPNPAEPLYVLTALRQGYRLATDDAEVAPPNNSPPVHAKQQPSEPTDIVLPILFGRSQEQSRLEDWLFRRRGSWLTLTGVGGVGKSALLDWAHARALAQGLTCRRVSLGDAITVGSLLERIAHAGQISIPPDAEPEPLLAMALRARPGLWLLDDLASLDPQAIEALDRLFSPFEQVRVLATRRRPLQSLDEVVFPLTPLKPAAAAHMYRALSSNPERQVPKELPLLPLWVRLAASDEAHGDAQLSEQALVESAIAGAPAATALELLGWHPPEADAGVLNTLLEVSSAELDAWRRRGLIEVLPGGRIRTHAVIREALRERSARTDRLGHRRRDQLNRLIRYLQVEAAAAFEHHPTQVRRKVLDYLDRLLTWVRGVRPEQVDGLFEALPVLIKVVTGSGRERSWVEALDHLAHRLERRGETGGAARLRLAVFDISDPIAPADEQLGRLSQIQPEYLDPPDQDLRDILIAGVHVRTGHKAPASAILKTFEDRVHQLLPGTRVRYRIAQSGNLRWQANYTDALAEAVRAVAEARSSAPLLETAALLQQVKALREGGVGEEVGPALAEAEAAATRWDDHAALATCVHLQAQDAISRGYHERAMERAEHALSLSHPGSETYVRALRSAAVAHRMVGSHERSEQLLQAALTAAREQSDTGLALTILDSLGSARLLQDDMAGAMACYNEAIEAAQSMGETREMKRIHGNIAQAYIMAEDWGNAAKHQALGRIEGPAPAGWVLTWTWRQAVVLFKTGDRAQARTCLLEVLDLILAAKFRSAAIAAAVLAADWLFQCGQTDAALAICVVLPYNLAIEDGARLLPEPMRVSLRHPGDMTLDEIIALAHDALENPALGEAD
ncbi:MAG: winged helix-turn-helix domain-containing protein [Myxococcota bacterium]